MSTLKVNAIRQTAATSDVVTLASDGTCTVRATNNLSNRNILVNGAMQIAQRGTSFAAIANQAFCLDRWRWENNGPSTAATLSQSSESPDGFGSSLKIDITTADTSIAAADRTRLVYKIEGQDLQALAKGTSGAKTSVLSFYVKTNKTGVYTVMFYDNDNNRMWSGSYTVSNTNWNRYTLAIPADTTGAYGNDNASSLEMYFGLSIGSDRTSGSLASSWASYSAANEHVGQVNLADSTSNEFHITGVQYEVDSTGSGVATDFEHRSYADELARCQRYFYMLADGSVKTSAAIADGRFLSASEVDFMVSFPCTMRATPSLYQVSGGDYFKIMYSGYNQYVDGDWTIQYAQPNGCSHYATPDATGATDKPAQIVLQNAAARLGYNAEL